MIVLLSHSLCTSLARELQTLAMKRIGRVCMKSTLSGGSSWRRNKSTKPNIDSNTISSTSGNNSFNGQRAKVPIKNSEPKIPAHFTGATLAEADVAARTKRQPYLSETAAFDLKEFTARICVIGVGGGGCNAVNNMVSRGLEGVDFICTNTDAQHLAATLAPTKIQLGREATEGLGCGAEPILGRAAAEESREDIRAAVGDAHLVFITAGMGGGTGTGAAPVIAELCQDMGILTVAVVTKPFAFEGRHRMRLANEGIRALQDRTDTIITIPNQNLFSIVDKNTTFIDAFKVADDVLLAGVRSITDLIIKPGMINLDFADVRATIQNMGNAMMGTGQAEGEDRAVRAAEDALQNPLLGTEGSVRSAKAMLVNITGGSDLTLFEVDRAAQHVSAAIDDEDANIIFGSSFDPELEGAIRVSVVATGFDTPFQ